MIKTLSKKERIEKAKEIALNNKGKCLSNIYVDHKSKLIFCCNEGHTWSATYKSVVLKKTWCPICSSGLYERICRTFLEQIFKEKFPPKGPKWLKNKNNNQLYLDGYCEKLGLAFEHNGAQHFTENNYFHKTKENYLNQLNNDFKKTQKCIENNVKLIIIPQLETHCKIKDFKNYIEKICKDLKIQLPKDFKEIILDTSSALNSFNYFQFEKLKEVVKIKNGECLSELYTSNRSKMKFRCFECNHIWETTSACILDADQWCPKCNGCLRLSKKDLDFIAAKNNGFCLSENYTSSSDKYIWKCGSCFNIWHSTYNNIQSGKWCKPCGLKKRSKKRILDITVYKKIAVERGGECLSMECNGGSDVLLWRCSSNHEWKSKASIIKNGSWCPSCSNLIKNEKLKSFYLNKKNK